MIYPEQSVIMRKALDEVEKKSVVIFGCVIIVPVYVCRRLL